ncbi:MAG: methionine--tRNA ligase [Candidatus Magasanikiibacteriota bacterium]
MTKHMNNKFYLTTTLPYVNAEPHIGFALEIIQADVIARYHKLLGEEIIFNTGTDEHGLKIYRKAEELGVDPQKYCDEYAAKFDALKQALNLSYTHFIRTTDEHHIKAAQVFWLRCEKNGDIYKKNYKVKYCVGCELEKTDSELVDDKCPVHPNLNIELIEEENYFFKFSKFQKPLLNLYESNPEFVVPAHRQHEIKNFVERGLEDFSISRLKAKMPWGIPVPNDPDHVMYVWFDALINYISTLGWPEDENNFYNFWPGVQVAGKDNLRQQSAMWQAMLLSAGLPTSKQIFIHGFITSEGQKMSKSLGNVVEPYKIVDKYGTDATRYFLLGGLPSYEDGDFSVERFEDFYTAHLVNGVGNLTSRILSMLEKYSNSKMPEYKDEDLQHQEKVWGDFWLKYKKYLGEYNFFEVVDLINHFVSRLDELISSEKPWEKVKNGEDISILLVELALGLRDLGIALQPIIPNSAQKILNSFGIENITLDKNCAILKPGTEIKKGEILFPRLEK